jgi:uncharacterized membrane protein required for colicin V production
MDLPQKIFFGAAGFILLFQLIRGWQRGPIRQIASSAVLAGGIAVGYLFGKIAVPFLQPFGLPHFVSVTIGCVAVGLIAYLIGALFAAVLFRKTSDQTNGVIWFLYGSTGALLGLAYGLILVLGVTLGIRILGSFADQRANVQNGKTILPSPVSIGLTRLERSLHQGHIGEVLQVVDPLPKDFYQNATKLSALIEDPQGLQKLLAAPEAKALAAEPKIVALAEDADFIAALQARNYAAILTNPKLAKACNDPKVMEKISKLNLRPAVDFALLH